MNKDKIANLIYELRKEKGLTQRQLADKLYISDKAISKWERGICIPELTMFKELSNIFDISVAELISGERFNNQNKFQKIDELYLSNLKKEKKNHLKIFLLSLILFIFITLSFFFIKNYKRIYIYKFKGDTMHYTFSNSLAIYSDKQGFIKLGNFKKIKNYPLDINNLKTAEILVAFDDIELYNFKVNFEEENISLDEWLENIDVEDFEQFDVNCQKGCEKDSFVTSNKKDFPNNLRIEMEYCDYNKCYKEEFKIKAEIMASNDLFNFIK